MPQTLNSTAFSPCREEALPPETLRPQVDLVDEELGSFVAVQVVGIVRCSGFGGKCRDQ